MAVPAPSIAVVQLAGGVHHYRYTGNVGVAGVAQTLNVDLTAIPERLRRDPNFQDQLKVDFKALDTGLSAVSPAVLTAGDFFDDGDAVNAYFALSVTSDLATRQCLVLIELPHTYTR